MPGYLTTSDGEQHPIGAPLTLIECFRCGVCCRRYQPPIDLDEARTIAQGLDITLESFLSEYAQMTMVGRLIRQRDGHCLFLASEDGGGATCTIHPFRPLACREWVASLARKECRDGLALVKADRGLVRVEDVFGSSEASDEFTRRLGH